MPGVVVVRGELDARECEHHSAQASAHDGSLVAGYKAAFLVSIGISVAAILSVAVQMRIRAAAKGTA
ncbi:MAG: hypothetical protein ACRDP7_45280 [Trebonia sp.]